MDNAIVKLDGKGLIATLSTSKFTNVCHHVLNTEYTIWNLLNVSAIDIGLDQIARNVSFTRNQLQYKPIYWFAYCNFIYHTNSVIIWRAYNQPNMEMVIKINILE